MFKTIRVFALIASVAAALALSACGGGGGGGGTGPSIISSAQAQSAAPVIGRLHFILRPDSTGRWYIQDDAGHRSEGVVLQVVQYPTHLRVNFVHSWRYAGTIQISSDDGFGRIITGHGNLGTTATEIAIQANGQVIDPATVWQYLPGGAASGNGNLWVNVTMVD